VTIVGEIARAIGTVEGMIGGQVVDLESEGKPISPPVLEYIHRSKTGALLTACTRCGAIAAGCTAEQLRTLSSYGAKIGLAFQIVDDILDVTASSEKLGKTAGKDAKVKKATYPALYGIEASRAKARELVLLAIAVMALLAGGLSFAIRQDLAVSNLRGDRLVAHVLARAGVERATAAVMDDSTAVDTLKDAWSDDSVAMKEVELTGGTFTVVHGTADATPLAAYGALHFGWALVNAASLTFLGFGGSPSAGR
jgi:hypothetical protein